MAHAYCLEYLSLLSNIFLESGISRVNTESAGRIGRKKKKKWGEGNVAGRMCGLTAEYSRVRIQGNTETVIGRLGTLNNLAYILRSVTIKLLRDVACRGSHSRGWGLVTQGRRYLAVVKFETCGLEEKPQG